MKVTIRGYVFGVTGPIFTEEVESEQLTSFEDLAKRHVEKFEGKPHAIEIEFPKTDTKPATLFRFGTEPRLMSVQIPLLRLTAEEVECMSAQARQRANAPNN